MRFRRFALAVLALLLLTAMLAPGSAQTLPPPVPRIPNPAGPPASSDEPGRERMEKEMAKRANQERQAQLKRDADRLFKLATELKTSVDKSSENTLSLDVVKKAEEIEKLAHSVKEKMKGN